jgi:predicted transcriptional regulator
MNVTLTLDDNLVKRVRRLAAERDTTMTALIRKHLELIAPAPLSAAEKKRRLAALEESIRTMGFHSGGKQWTREERNARPSKYLGTR